MRKERMFNLVILAIVFVSIMSLPQAYASTRKNLPGPQIKPPTVATELISSVSNPSGSCGSFGLTGTYGNVMFGNGHVVVVLQNANPSNTYTVSVDRFTQGACDGSWQSVGSISTDQKGNGLLVQQLNLQLGHDYVFEFRDTQGSLVYATG